MPALPSHRLVLPLLLTLAAPVLAQGSVVEDWTQTVTLSGSQIHGVMGARDATGAIYVTGHNPYDRIVTAKFAADGTPLWQQTFQQPSLHFQASWLTVDPFGDVLVSGYQVSTSTTQPLGLVLLKYDPAGNLLWSDVVSGLANVYYRVAADANGDVVAVGVAPAIQPGGLVRKYSRTGTVLWDVPVAGRVVALAIDAAGTIFVAGNAATTLTVSAFTPGGSQLWTHTQANATGATDVALAPNGDVYVSGALLSATTSDKSLILKFASGGALQWAQNYQGTQARRLAVDHQGDVVFIAAASPGGGYFNWQTRKVTPAGATLWLATYDHHAYNDEIPNALAIGRGDEVYVTGQGGPGPTSGTLSYQRQVTVRYSRFGSEEWVGSSFTSSNGLGLVLQEDGSVATVGQSTFTVFHYRQRGVWWSLDGALAGARTPQLAGSGSPVANAPVQIELTQGAPNAPVWLVAGFSRVQTPFLGGTLVPAPDLVLFAATNGSGSLAVPLAWPAGLPAGLEITLQAWLVDAAAPQGYAASNALVAISG